MVSKKECLSKSNFAPQGHSRSSIHLFFFSRWGCCSFLLSATCLERGVYDHQRDTAFNRERERKKKKSGEGSVDLFPFLSLFSYVYFFRFMFFKRKYAFIHSFTTIVPGRLTSELNQQTKSLSPPPSPPIHVVV